MCSFFLLFFSSLFFTQMPNEKRILFHLLPVNYENKKAERKRINEMSPTSINWTHFFLAVDNISKATQEETVFFYPTCFFFFFLKRNRNTVTGAFLFFSLTFHDSFCIPLANGKLILPLLMFSLPTATFFFSSSHFFSLCPSLSPAPS